MAYTDPAYLGVFIDSCSSSSPVVLELDNSTATERHTVFLSSNGLDFYLIQQYFNIRSAVVRAFGYPTSTNVICAFLCWIYFLKLLKLLRFPTGIAQTVLGTTTTLVIVSVETGFAFFFFQPFFLIILNNTLFFFFLFISFQFNKDPDCANITRNSTCGSGLYCNPWNFTCVPKWFSCDVNSWGTGDGCDCDCGSGVSVDPDCKANRFYYGGRDGAQPTVKGCNGIPGATCDSAVFTCKCFFKHFLIFLFDI